VAGVVLAHVAVPGSFRLIMALGAVTAVPACVIASFLPGRPEESSAFLGNRSTEANS
jgi:hypothetical protein